MKYNGYEMENLFGEINKENVFIGNLKKCIKHQIEKIFEMESFISIDTFGYIKEESEDYKKEEIIIKICNNPEIYVTLKELKNFLSYVDVYSNVSKNGISISGKILATSPSYVGEIFVDKKSLKPYYENEKGKVKVRKIKRDSLLDVRIKGGIEH